MKIISIAGQLGNGKDVLADYLAERLNQREKTGTWERHAFANAVKKVYMDSFGVTRDFIEEWKRKDEPPPGMLLNVRKSLQFIGDGFRQIRGDIWIDIALRPCGHGMVISDSRYINEARAVKKRDGFNIVLWREGFENSDPNPSESQIKEVVDWCLATNQNGVLFYGDMYRTAEVPEKLVGVLDNYDLFVRNTGSIQDLYDQADEMILPLIEAKYDSSR